MEKSQCVNITPMLGVWRLALIMTLIGIVALPELLFVWLSVSRMGVKVPVWRIAVRSCGVVDSTYGTLDIGRVSVRPPRPLQFSVCSTVQCVLR